MAAAPENNAPIIAIDRKYPGGGPMRLPQKTRKNAARYVAASAIAMRIATNSN